MLLAAQCAVVFNITFFQWYSIPLLVVYSFFSQQSSDLLYQELFEKEMRYFRILHGMRTGESLSVEEGQQKFFENPVACNVLKMDKMKMNVYYVLVLLVVIILEVSLLKYFLKIN